MRLSDEKIVSKSIVVFRIIIALSLIVAMGVYVSTHRMIAIDGPVDVDIINDTTLYDEIGRVAIEWEHYQIHKGHHFFSKGVLDFNGGANENQQVMFLTPNDSIEIHAKAIIYANVEIEVEILENCTVTANGTQLETFNNNRWHNNGEHLLSWYGPTVTSCEKAIWVAKTGSGKDATGVAPGLNYEIIAKPNAYYVFNITKLVVQTGYVDTDFFWYEEEED